MSAGVVPGVMIPAAAAGDEATGMARFVANYCRARIEGGYSIQTMRQQRCTLDQFAGRCAAAGILHPDQISAEFLDRVRQELIARHTQATARSHVSILRCFLRALASEGAMDFAALAALSPAPHPNRLRRREIVAASSGALAAQLPAYLAQLRDRNYSAATIRGRARELNDFLLFCRDRAIDEPAQLSVALIERFRRDLARRISAFTGRRLSPTSQISRLSMLRDYLRFLVKRGLLLFNPALEVELPKIGVRLPRGTLSALEVERILVTPDIETPVGLRDRAILETLYSTALRRSELAALDLGDVNFTAGTVFVRQGKGQVDRVAPVGERALLWLSKYIESSRPALLLGGADEAALFVSLEGRRLSADRVTEIARESRIKAGVDKDGAAHLFRHTAATLMLENGADVRHVQQLLGHRELSSTQRYTHVAIRQLKEVHARTHPGAKLKKQTRKNPGVAS